MSITLQVGVKVLLRNKQGKHLLLRRSAQKYPEVKDPWDLVGGRIEPGIPLLENLQREVGEETGLTLNSTPQLIAAQDILRNPDKHIVRLTYLAEVEGEPTLDQEEHEEFKWLTLTEIKNLQGLDCYFKEILSKFTDKFG